jgi:hypothetical protein
MSNNPSKLNNQYNQYNQYKPNNQYNRYKSTNQYKQSTPIDKNILKNFPQIKLSYENMIHKKVSTFDYLVAIPEGRKYFIWFTIIENKSTCFLMELNRTKEIINITRIRTYFSLNVYKGTIFYGTLFDYSGQKFYSIEDILAYEGTMLIQKTWLTKLDMIKYLLKSRQSTTQTNSLIFGLPLMSDSAIEFNKQLKEIKYRVYSIQYKLYNKINTCLSIHYDKYLTGDIENKNTDYNYKVRKYNSQTTKDYNAVFMVRPDLQNDIYHLYCLDKDFNEIEYGIAHIKDFKTSVFMNKLFRVIKENDNLDALEESDDDEEFHNDRIDRYVYLSKSYKILCQYNAKFRRWMPCELATERSVVGVWELETLNI